MGLRAYYQCCCWIITIGRLEGLNLPSQNELFNEWTDG